MQAVLGKTFENIANFFAKNTVQWGMQRNDQARSWSHSQLEHYFYSYLHTWEVDLIEIPEIMAQI